MILDGKALSERRLELLKDEIRESGLNPTLATVLVGEDPASKLYVSMKHRACEQVGIQSLQITLEADIKFQALLKRLQQLNEDPDIDGILVQLPLPDQINQEEVLSFIRPEKDVDGFNPINMGRLMANLPGPRPCTPKGIMTLLREYEIELDGKLAVVIGRSVDVGRPLSLLLLHANATVTIAHSHTKNLPSLTKQADILISAVGKPRMVSEEMVKEGAVVIDVGTNRVDGKLCGDVDFSEVMPHCSAITPVPGGVGPMTIISLMENTYEAAILRCRSVI